MLITVTKIQACCTLRIPFDIVFRTLFHHGSHPKRPWQTYMFYKHVHNSGSKGSPDMILSAFYVKFHETKNDLPPEA